MTYFYTSIFSKTLSSKASLSKSLPLDQSLTLSEPFVLKASETLGGDRSYFEDGGVFTDWTKEAKLYDGTDLSEGYYLGDLPNEVNAHGGQDIVYGGASADRIDLGAGDDKAFGYGGNDYIQGGHGDDTVNGGEGDDILIGGPISLRDPATMSDDDVLNGGAGNDWILGEAGNDVIDGGTGHDTAGGGHGNDALYGRAGNDVLDGNAGNDDIHGGEGQDTIDGGAGNDWLWGDAGEDLFVFRAGQAGHDMLLDLSAQDRVEIDVDFARLADLHIDHQADGTMISWTHQGAEPARESVFLLNVTEETFQQMDIALV